MGARTSGPTVVFVILDELPVTSLMSAEGDVDAQRFPNFAALARDSIWFRNTTGVHVATWGATPAIMDGRYPREGAKPVLAEHPQNVFTFFGASHRLHVVEPMTRLCPASLCRSPGPLVKSVWRYEPVAEWTRFVAGVKPTSRPSLEFAHLLLPHAPWRHMPSCRRYGTKSDLPGFDSRTQRWMRSEYLAALGMQRHLLQAQCTDRLLGRLLARLRTTGLYDRSVIVVVADHGVSARPGQLRRGVHPKTPTNLQDVAFVPFFLKLPGQTEPVVIDEHVQTIDVLPTVVAAAGLPLPWTVDGRSALAGPYSDAMRFSTGRRGVLNVTASSLLPRREATLRWQQRLFGGGLFALGPNPELVGRRVRTLSVLPSSGASMTLDAELALALRALPATLPAPLTGDVAGLRAGTPLAVAVNGRVAGVGRTFRREGKTRFSVLVPETSFRRGANAVEVFSVKRSDSAVTLTSLGRTGG